MRQSKAVWTTILVLCLPVQDAVGSELRSVCQTVSLPERTMDMEHVYRLDETFSFVIALNTVWDSQADFGTRLLLRKKSDNTSTITYHSTGSADSYGMRPTFVRYCGGHDMLIFGEIGTEYSWGLRVFAYNTGTVVDLGEIPLAVEGEDIAVSVVPFMRFSHVEDFLEISFIEDVIKDPGGRQERRIPGSTIKYRIQGNRLVELRS